MYNREIINLFSTLETPFYYYDVERLNNVLGMAKSLAEGYGYHIHYAVKANANNRILDIVKSFGFGADCVSGNEVLKAVERGFAPKSVAFAGVGKSDREILDAIDSNIGVFHIESLAELEVVNQLAEQRGVEVNVALRLNPNVDAKTHAYITTGLNENKFGINPWELEMVLELLPTLKNTRFIGLHFHIGSQITDMSVFEELAVKTNHFVEWFEQRNCKISYINLGGGLGVDYVDADNYMPDFEGFFSAIYKNLNRREDQEVHFELGRSLVATCGDLISKVLYIKKGLQKNFVILDAGMTELIRPALYGSSHQVQNLSSEQSNVTYDVVGPVCESSDTFARALALPESKRGDLFTIRTTGAYGHVMSSNYNLRATVNQYFSDEIHLIEA